MPQSLEFKLSEAWPPSDWSDVTVIAAISGGCDSVALLRAMAAVRRPGPGRICVAHLNHQLRPNANDDEAFVVDLCRQLEVACEVGRIAVEDSGDGIEAAARKARYRFLEQAAERWGARFVATAHTADDQAETILHRIVRGTGIRGLSGMARTRPLGHATLIRPLLAVHRVELQAYLDSLAQPYRHDETNADVRFTRNRIRHEVMPELRERFNPGVADALLRLGALAGETQAVVDGLVEELFARCVTIEGPRTASVDLRPLADRPRYIVRELLMALWRHQRWPLQAMGRRKWDDLSELALSSTPQRQAFPGDILVDVTGETMQLSRSAS
jgi:tRNA(Ile)-lysidine synthase